MELSGGVLEGVLEVLDRFRMDGRAPKEGTRMEGTGFSDSERSAVPNLVVGMSQTSD
jgi:hypothetical protein